jgi:Zn-dependent protease
MSVLRPAPTLPAVTGARFRVLGIPVNVAPEFLLGLAIPFLFNDLDAALALAVCLAAFVLVHELGHALVARRTGAETSITLTFLVGYASYRPTKQLDGAQRALISVAGPLTQLVLGGLVLVALGVSPLRLHTPTDSIWTIAVWWAGPVLAALNLLPLHPLDGGHLLELGLTPLVGRRALTVVQWWTVAACVVLLALAVVNDSVRWWWPTIVLFGVWSVGTTLASRRNRRPPDRTQMLTAVAGAEAQAWERGKPGLFPPPYHVSPWYRAYTLRRAGRADQARETLLASLRGGDRAWLPPAAAPDEVLRDLVGLLPADGLPVDDLHGGLVLASVLHRLGDLRRAASYAGSLYERTTQPVAAIQAARSLALLGDADGAMRWLQRAGRAAVSVDLLQGDPDLDSLRTRPDFRELVGGGVL